MYDAVETFRQARKGGAERSDVLRERYGIPVRFVLPTLAHPHEKARGGQATEHLHHLSDAVDEVVKFRRDLPRVGVVRAVVAMSAFL